MTITIQITFLSYGIRCYKAATFPLRGRTHTKVLEDWIMEIKREMDVEQVLKVLIDGEEIELL